MKVSLEIGEDSLLVLAQRHIEDKLNMSINKEDLNIMVKSKQNYKSEWERADFKITYEGLQ